MPDTAHALSLRITNLGKALRNQSSVMAAATSPITPARPAPLAGSPHVPMIREFVASVAPA
jgi:hypothetical protein